MKIGRYNIKAKEFFFDGCHKIYLIETPHDKKDFLRNYNVKQYNKLLKEMPDWFQRRIKRRVRSIKKLVRPHRKKGYFILSFRPLSHAFIVFLPTKS